MQFSLTMAIDESNPLDQVKISGYIDRLEAEVEDAKKLHIIDFKTSKDTLSKEQAQKVLYPQQLFHFYLETLQLFQNPIFRLLINYFSTWLKATDLLENQG